MKTRSGIKISDKLAVLMTGLVLGFFLIGLAYFFQVPTTRVLVNKSSCVNKLYRHC